MFCPWRLTIRGWMRGLAAWQSDLEWTQLIRRTGGRVKQHTLEAITVTFT